MLACADGSFVKWTVRNIFGKTHVMYHNPMYPNRSFVRGAVILKVGLAFLVILGKRIYKNLVTIPSKPTKIIEFRPVGVHQWKEGIKHDYLT